METPDVAPVAPIRIPSKKKIALVCSGGATKAGAFHLGVALALQEQGFKFYGGLATTDSGSKSAPGPMEISTFVGSSAGSIICTYLAAGYTLEQIFDSFLDKDTEAARKLPRLTYQKMFKLRSELAKEQMGQIFGARKALAEIFSGNFEAITQLRWLKATGIFSTSGIEQYLREEVLPSNTFKNLAADLFIVGTQLNHSRKVVFGKYSFQPPPNDLTCQYENDVPISEACAASTALPFIYAPFAIKHRNGVDTQYIDGEIRDTLSTHIAIDAGADLVIASYTHQPYHLQEGIGSLTEHGLPAILVQSLYLVIEQKINNHIHNKDTQREAILEVDRYCRMNGVSEEHRKAISNILQAKLHHRLEVDTIYIHPDPKDANLFFGDHFSLSPKKMGDIVRSGFRAAIDTLKKYEFADKRVTPVVTTTEAGASSLKS